MNVLMIPTEIQEKILGYLQISDLASAARSCVDWQRISNDRLFKRWCLKNISPDVLDELTDSRFSQSPDSFDWECLCSKWSKMAAVVEDRPDVDAITVTTCCVCMVASGDFVIVGDHFNNIVWYDSRGTKTYEKSNFGEPVLAMGLLNFSRSEPYSIPDSDLQVQHDALAVISNEFIAIYAMPAWNCRELFFLNVKHGTKCISAQGAQFAYYNSFQNVMTVCAARVSDAPYPERVKIVERCAFPTSYNVHNWKLWKNSVICLLQNGTVLTWNLESGTSSQSIFVSDFLYPFESFLFRGLIFCNISTARALLNYWHVNMGAPHWLVSTDGLTFRRMKTSFDFGDEITTIHIKRTVIVVGTSGGKICIYRHTGSDHDVPETMLQGPLFVYKIANGPIFRCDFSLDGEEMTIFAKTAMNTVLLLKLPVIEKYN